MKLILLLVLLGIMWFSNNATICAVLFTMGIGVMSAVSGAVVPFIIGQAIANLILSGLYFGFLGRLDKEGWVYWTVLVGGGLFLVRSEELV